MLNTVDILIGVWHEERDLVRKLGPAYTDYQRRVPKLLRRFRRRAIAKARRP